MRKYILLALFLFTSVAHAQTQAVIQKPTAKVYANASAKSDVLVVLKKGSKVDVAGVTESGWAKVKVTVSGFQFEGWVVKSALSKVKAPAPAPRTMMTRVAPTPAPAPRPAVQQPTGTLTPTSSTQLEQFFEPSGSSSGSASAPAPAPQPVARVEESRSSSRESSNESSPGDSWTAGKLILMASPGYMFHQYTFSDATKDAFRYNLSGPSLTLGAEYNAYAFFDDLIRMGVVFQGQYVFLNTKTNLLDGTNTQFSDLTAKNRLMDIWLKLKFMVNFDRIASKPFLIGVTGGYQYMRFFGDDIVDDTNTPVGLFVDQTTKSIPVGIVGELHFLDPVVLTMGGDVLLKNSTSEKPSASSGTKPSAKMGFAPYLYLNFPITGQHYMGIRYQYRIQETNYAGPSSSRVNNTLNAATSLQTFHTLGLEYDYHF